MTAATPRLFRLLALFSLFAAGAALAQPAPAPPGATAPAPGHRFACADYTAGKVFLVAADGKVLWEYAAPSCNDLWALPNGNLLFTTGKGVKEVTPEKKVVFSYESTSEIYACQRLPDGNTFVGECSAGRLLEVDPAGKIVKEIKLLPDGKGGHLYMRNARRLASGHYLVSHYGQGVVREYDADGKLTWEVAAPGGPHSALRLPDGNTLIAAADKIGPTGCKVFEVNPKGETVWQITSADLPPDLSLKFMAGLHRLPNGNTLMCNWLGHGQLGKSAHVIEVTRDKKVVWSFADHQTMKTISTIQALDVAGDAVKGEIWH
jgi:hypothetical protein